MAGVADKNALKAGLFIVGSVVLALVVFFSVTGLGFLDGQKWTVRFGLSEDVSGIASGSEVRVGGLKRGQVESIDLSDDLKYVEVRVRLPDDLKLKKGAKVTVQSTVTGVAWLNFSDLGDGDELSPKNPLDGSAGSLSSLLASVNEIAPQATELVRHVRETTLPKVDSTFDKIDTAVGSVDDVMTENRADLRKTIQQLTDASDRVPKLLDDLSTAANRVDTAVADIRKTLDGTGKRLNTVLDEAQTVAANAKDTSEAVRDIIVGNRGKIEQIIARARDAAGTLNLAASEIRRSPWRLLYKPDGKQRESLDLYDTARRFAEGANALQDAAVSLQDAAADPNAQTAEVQALINDLQSRFADFDKVQGELYKRLQN